MPAYVIFIRERVIDPEEMDRYREKARRARGSVPPKPLAYYGALETLEGPEADGVAVFAFEDMDNARRWYRSEAYQEALPHRIRGADYRVLLTDGLALQAQ